MATSATSLQKPHLADAMGRLGTESAFDVLVRAHALEAAGREVIHLEIGEPDFPTPPHIVEGAVDALRYGWTQYGPAAGQPALREAVAEDAGRRRGISIDPSEVVITPGAKPILFFSILALVDRGDEVIYPNPGFPIYESMINFAGGRAVPYGLREEHDFDVDIGQIIDRVTDRTRLVILNSPQNPTGGVMPPDEVEELARALAGRDLFILSDEIYSRLIYDGAHASIAQFAGLKDRTIILDGFSKTYAMTGWRLGYGIMRADLAERVAQLQTNATSCTASFTQMAGVTALRADQTCVDEMREEFRRRRSVMVEGLNAIPGFRCRQPHGAFYAFPNISSTKRSSKALADALLNEAGVAALSGAAFGNGGEGHLRFSFANSVENIQKALDWIGDWVKKNS
ncbi:MAG TPA: pyridoxal phosphate-dependent aminotransferase [Terriglobia bacterium]|nr:pyridoxal phosphate-dependent aminotransferase [Terriglobia bacterium]